MKKLALALAALLALAAWWFLRGPQPGSFTPAAPTPGAGAPADAAASAPPSHPVAERIDASARAEQRSDPEPRSDAARVRGTITRAEDGAPVVGLEVVVFGGGAADSRSTTDELGRFELETAPGERRIGATSPGASAWCDPISLTAGEEMVYDRVLAERTRLCVRVWQAYEGRVEPFLGASVSVIQSELEDLDAQRWREALGAPDRRTDLTGRIDVGIADYARYVVLVEAPSFAPRVVELDLSPFNSNSPFQRDGCVHVLLEQDGLPVRGAVIDPAGRPVAGALVFLDAQRPAEARELQRYGQLPEGFEAIAPTLAEELHPRLVRTDARGAFRLPGPSPELGAISSLTLVVLPGRGDLVHHFTVALPEDAGRELSVDVRLPQVWPVQFVLVDAEGQPIDGLASARDAAGFAHAPPGALKPPLLSRKYAGRCFETQEGRFSLLHPGGTLRIGVSPDGQWRPGEVEVTVPHGGGQREVRVVLPR